MQALSLPVAPVVLPEHFMFSLVVNILDLVLAGNAFAYTMLAVIMLFGQALYLNNIAVRRRMFAKPMYNVAFMYIILTSLSPWFSCFNEVIVVNWLLLAALDILLSIHQTAQPRRSIFNAGFWLALAALMYFPAIIYLLLLLLALALLRSFNAGEWIVGLLGFFTPLYFAAGILFLIDKFELMLIWPEWHFWFPQNTITNPVYTFGTVAGIVILLFSGAFVLQSQTGKISVFARRNWSLITIFIILSGAVALTTDRAVKNAWLTAMPALSLVMAHPLYMEKNKRFSNFIFYFSLIFVIFCQLALNK